MPKILVASSYVPAKSYMLPRLVEQLQALGGDDVLLTFDGCMPFDGIPSSMHVQPLPELEGPDPDRYRSLCRVRREQRALFLAGDWDYLYWHDADMLAPQNAILTLAAHKLPVVSGCYNIRNLYCPAICAAIHKGDQFKLYPVEDISMRWNGVDPVPVDTVGMGSFLVDRATLEAVAFPEDSFWDGSQVVAEDFYWCAAYKEATGKQVTVDPAVCCWHVADTGMASRLHFGDRGIGAVWHGSSWICVNQYGAWYTDVPRYHLPESVANGIGTEFEVFNGYEITVDVGRLGEI